MSRLTTMLSIIVILLSGVVVYTIYDIKKESTIEDNVDMTMVNKEEASTNTTEGEEVNEQIEVVETIDNEETKTSSIQKYNLNTEELYSLINSGNPFGSSLSKNNTSLKEKIDKQIESNTNNESSALVEIVTKESISEIVELKAKKYDIPATWIYSIIENTSNYENKPSTNVNNVIRKGIMHIREDKMAFIAESIGLFYEPNLDTNVETNIEMGAYYLSYLAKQNSDEHYPFSTYDIGPIGAKNTKVKNGNYSTDFSLKVLQTIKNSTSR